MVLVYEGGPYAGQDDYLAPAPRRLRAHNSDGYYQQTPRVDGLGRRVYEWVPRRSYGARAGSAPDA